MRSCPATHTYLGKRVWLVSDRPMHHETLLTIEHIDGRREFVAADALTPLPDPPARPQSSDRQPVIHGDFKPYYSYTMGIGPTGVLGRRGLPGETYNADGAVLVKGRSHERDLARRLDFRSRKSYG